MILEIRHKSCLVLRVWPLKYQHIFYILLLLLLHNQK